MSKLDYCIHDEADARGSVLVPDELQQGELVAFRPSSATIEFEAQSDAELVLGSAVPHDCDLVLCSHSVHTSTHWMEPANLARGLSRPQFMVIGRLRRIHRFGAIRAPLGAEHDVTSLGS